MRIALDAMGGDHAPREIVAGAVQAIRDFDLHVVLVGDEKQIRALVPEPWPDALSIVHAPGVVPMGAHPIEAIRKTRDASVVVATRLVKEGKADAVVSAGSTGAAMASAMLSWRSIEGIERPAISTILPTKADPCILLDVGANVDCRPNQLVQFAAMGSVYSQRVRGVAVPRVGLLSNGEEETKGNELVQEVHARLKQTPGLNFIGNVEGRDILAGVADVIVCDGFVGNVVLKFAEGMASTLFEIIRQGVARDARSKLGALLLKPALKAIWTRLDYSEYGGAPLLGVNGVCIISHGASNAKAIRNALRVAKEAVEQRVVEAIAEQSGVRVNRAE